MSRTGPNRPSCNPFPTCLISGTSACARSLTSDAGGVGRTKEPINENIRSVAVGGTFSGRASDLSCAFVPTAKVASVSVALLTRARGSIRGVDVIGPNALERRLPNEREEGSGFTLRSGPSCARFLSDSNRGRGSSISCAVGDRLSECCEADGTREARLACSARLSRRPFRSATRRSRTFSLKSHPGSA